MPVAAVAGLVFFATVAEVQGHAQVQVEGTTSCPSPESVAARLANLLSADAVVTEPDRAHLSEEGDEIVIVLERADGVLLGTRRLPRTHACEDLAAAAAVSLAAWESDVHPEFAPGLAARASARPAVPALLMRTLPAPSPAPRPWQARVGVALGFGGSVDAPAPAGGVVVGAWLTPPYARTSVRTEIEGQTERQVSLRDGQASWRRLSLGLGLERSFFANTDGSSGWLRWFALARLAWLDLRGQGFAVNHQDGAFDPGALAGLRAVRARGRWSSWVELAASFWPVRHDVLAQDSVGDVGGDVGRVPAAEVFVRIGAGWGSAP